MSDEFGLAGGGEEHVEDRLECFRTECHRRPQQAATQCTDMVSDTLVSNAVAEVAACIEQPNFWRVAITNQRFAA